jgi:CRP/FNR family transcriptional regulator, nitrogen oxide reductase regulator
MPADMAIVAPEEARRGSPSIPPGVDYGRGVLLDRNGGEYECLLTKDDRCSLSQRAGARIDMTLSEALVLLRGLEPGFLEGLTPADQATLFQAATVHRFEPGSLITRQGFPAERLALLVRGRARFTCTTRTGRKVNLHWIQPGEVCGLASLLLHPRDYLISAEAVKASVALVWRRPAIRAFAAICPRILDNALLLGYEYIRLYRNAHVSGTSRSARQRLALVLGAMAEGIGHEVKDGIELNVRNEDLAHEANMTIFTTSRLLNEWQRESLLVKTRGKILVRSPQDLLRRAS